MNVQDMQVLSPSNFSGSDVYRSDYQDDKDSNSNGTPKLITVAPKLFVGQIPKTLQVESLRQIFAPFGKIHDINVSLTSQPELTEVARLSLTRARLKRTPPSTGFTIFIQFHR